MIFLNRYIRPEFEYIGMNAKDVCPKCKGLVCAFKHKDCDYVVQHCEVCHFIFHYEDNKIIEGSILSFFATQWEDHPQEEYH